MPKSNETWQCYFLGHAKNRRVQGFYRETTSNYTKIRDQNMNFVDGTLKELHSYNIEEKKT
jgi:hypothetical protein